MSEDSTAELLPFPARFGALPRYGGQGIIRRPWERPALAAAPALGWCCQCVDGENGDAWDEVAAPFILREPEWRVWRRLPRSAARRRWMRGRVAAKDAVRWLLWERSGILAPLESICVFPDERGQPHVSCAGLPEAGTRMSVSISHSGSSSVALVAERSEFCRGVGIDVASQAEDHEGLAEGGFASAETALLDGCPAPERPDWLLRLWCAKEAVGKALGRGLLGNPLAFVVRRINRGRGTVEVEARLDLEMTVPADGPARMTARVGCDRGMAFAVARRE